MERFYVITSKELQEARCNLNGVLSMVETIERYDPERAKILCESIKNNINKLLFEIRRVE